MILEIAVFAFCLAFVIGLQIWSAIFWESDEEDQDGESV